MEVVTKFAVVAAVAVVFVGVVFGTLALIPGVPVVVSPVNPAIQWTELRDIVRDSCHWIGHFMVIPLSFFEAAIAAITAAIGIKIGIRVYTLI